MKKNKLAIYKKAFDIVKLFNVEKKLDDLLSLIISSISSLLDCQRSTLFLYDKKRNQLYSKVYDVLEIKEIRFSLNTGIAGRAARCKKCEIVSDPYSDSDFNPRFDERTNFTTCNILSSPLLASDGNLIGVVQALNKKGGCFDELDMEIIKTLSTHIAIAIENVRLYDQYKEKLEMEQSLRLAREIQESLLPRTLPEIAGYNFLNFYHPSEHVGGDYYDFLVTASGECIFIIADVAGHGTGPAILMSELRTLFRTFAREGGSLSEITSAMNDTLASDLSRGRFISAFLGCLDPLRSTLRFVNAGHTPGLFFSNGRDQLHSLSDTSIPLGILKDAEYPVSETITLAKGDKIFLFTDGLIDTSLGGRGRLGLDGLKDVLKAYKGGSATAIFSHLAGKLKAKRKAHKDDITFIIIEKIT